MNHEKEIREKAASFVNDIWNKRDYSVVPYILANPVLLHIKDRNINSTHDQLRHIVDRWHKNYHGFHFDIDALIVDGEMAVLLLMLRGIPVGIEDAEEISVRHVFILRFEQAIIVEAWELNDFP